MTAELIRAWCRSAKRDLDASQSSPGVQTAEEMAERMDERLAALHTVADRLYDRWIERLAA
jgi:hypothetical protein